MKAASVLIADDHELVRDGIRARIERQPGWRVCAEAGDGREAVALAVKFKPDIALLDIGMPGLNGIAATHQVRKGSPHTEVLILTMQESDDLIREALAAGARGFLLKTDAARQLMPAMEALLDHKTFFTSRAADVVLAGFLDPRQNAPANGGLASRLTAREREIVQLLAESHTSKEIAARLGVSTKTVEAHRANIMRKLNAHSVVDLVRYAIQHKLVQL